MDAKQKKMLMLGGGALVIVLAISTLKFSPKSPFDTLTGQMESMMKKGDYSGALGKARKRVEFAEENFKPDSVQLADSYHDVGAALAGDGKWVEAKSWILKSINAEMAARGEKAPTLPEKLVTLAEVSRGLGNSPEAEKYGSKATEIFRAQGQEKKLREQARAFAVTASAGLDQQACDRALAAAEGGMEFADKLGREYDLLQSLHTSAGRAEFCLNHPDKAEPYIKTALSFAKKDKKSADPELPALSSLQGEILCAMGKCKQGSKYHADAYKLAKKMYGDSDAKTLAYLARAEESSPKKGKKSKNEVLLEDRSEVEPAALPTDESHFENF